MRIRCMEAWKGDEVLHSARELLSKTVFQRHPRRRAIPRRAVRRWNAGLKREGEIASQVGVSFALQSAVKDSKTAMHRRFAVRLIREADAWRKVGRLRGHQALIAHILDPYVVLRQHRRKDRSERHILRLVHNLVHARSRPDAQRTVDYKIRLASGVLL